MRKLRAIPLVAFAAIIAAAFAAPAASANWSESGLEIAEPKTIEFEGNIKWSLMSSSLQCSDVDGNATLQPGKNGEITKFSINPASCNTFGTMFKGCFVDSIKTRAPMSIQAVNESEKPRIYIDGFSYTVHFNSCTTAPSEKTWIFRSGNQTANAPMVATPDNASAMSEFTFNGGQTAGGLVGSLTPSVGYTDGSFTITPSKAYGIEGASTYQAPNSWTKEGGALLEPKTIELDGTVKWNTLGSGIECTSHSEAELWPGSERGELTKFELSSGSCKGFGFAWKGCKVSAASATAPLPIKAVKEGETRRILISNLAYTLTVNSCTNGKANRTAEVKATGDVKATPGNADAISSLTLSGGLTVTEPGGSPESASIEGSPSVTPSGVYGIKN